MTEQLVVVITGAGRGIGTSLVAGYLARPNCTVIGTIRDETSPGVATLKETPRGANSELYLVKVDSSSPNDAADAIAEARARAGIDYIDVVIANAGVSPPVSSLDTVALSEVNHTFVVNALGPLLMYQACFPLLKESKTKNPKFIAITSAAGSIGNLHKNGAHAAPSYSISKAALNWITIAAHAGNEWLISAAINPGLVATRMGDVAVKHLGLEKAPWTTEQSAEKIISMIDGGTRDTISAKFLNAMDGTEIAW